MRRGVADAIPARSSRAGSTGGWPAPLTAAPLQLACYGRWAVHRSVKQLLFQICSNICFLHRLGPFCGSLVSWSADKPPAGLVVFARRDLVHSTARLQAWLQDAAGSSALCPLGRAHACTGFARRAVPLPLRAALGALVSLPVERWGHVMSSCAEADPWFPETESAVAQVSPT